MLVAVVGADLKSAPTSHAAVTLTVDSTQRYQTWEGWEVTAEHVHFDALTLGDKHPAPQNILNELLDDAVNNLGLTAVRLEVHPHDPKMARGMEMTNDNEDPFVLDPSKIRWEWLDPYVRCIALPMKQILFARGDKFTLNLHAVAWGSWHWREPASDPGQEYAEFMMACLDHLKDKFGVTPDYVTIYNEPDNGKEGKEKDVGKACVFFVIRGIKKLAARMQVAGYTTLLRFPDITRVENALSWFAVWLRQSLPCCPR